LSIPVVRPNSSSFLSATALFQVSRLAFKLAGSTPISLANQTESQPNLVNDLNKLAEQNVNKAEKLKMLKALIQ